MKPLHTLGTAAVLGATAVLGANLGIRIASRQRIHTLVDAPSAPVVIVLGAQVRDGWPMPMLASRLDTTAALVRAGKAGSVLVSGNGAGDSGNEITAMTDYLVELGVGRERILGDPLGVSTYDSMVQASQAFDIERALVVTQRFHLFRSLALGRALGIDAYGVAADNGCSHRTLARNLAREWLLSEPKAILDIARCRSTVLRRPPR